ncbi:TetR family transcriptional regulator [Thiogranum longum]|uniref:TetR family transcriptional regulator n=1 Tax=Thiogranum longum TaxID=1537524 RepID=A0A4R1HBL8_9GAMM|nr:TetR/AcrR family transcriptional regulator [Thiogranum longum]TCK17923.1 TetR family transcriptional regulator [Thiogranum longum]
MTKRLKASERKAAILAVAKVLFSDKGYHGVSVDEIARRVGVSPAILYRHFPSKESLYEEVLNQTACKRESYVEAVVQSDGSFSEVLRMITRRYVESVSRDPDYLRMELQSALEGSVATRQFFEHRWRPFTDYIEVTIRELQPTGKVQHTDGRIAALMFQGMLREALYAKCIFHTPRYQELDLNELTDYLVTLFFRAIGYREWSE